ncbi:MAG TPA: glycosyltransferase [Pseudobacteroides sp.]|uniref:glycosyltransferase n=1 Tax=Pseudobacteroides sp. TaxID=1968840 RepID=UPI002F92C08E
MKVAILTMFNGLDSTYSLVNVVAEHLKILLDAGIQTKVLVSEDCNDSEKYGIFLDDRIEWAKVANRVNGQLIHWYDYSSPTGKLHDTFFEEADVIAKDLIEKLADTDVCIMHDIHYQGWHLVHNVAIRKAQEHLNKIRFIAFTHSAPVNRPSKTEWPFSARYTPMPNTIYAYPTLSGLPALAKQYNVSEGKCYAINNSLDLLSGMSEATKSISSQFDILSPDILIVYPGRLTQGKKFEKVAAFAGAMKRKTERDVKVIFCDFPSSDINPLTYKGLIKVMGYNFGINVQDIAFTSDMGYPNGFPRESVLELFTLSNLFVCPSFSESFGLTILEAASRGNFLILNQSVPALEELGKKLHAYFMRWDARNFGYDTKEKYNPSERFYLEEHAEIVLNLMLDNSVIFAKAMVRQRYSPKWVWKNQLEPLLEI